MSDRINGFTVVLAKPIKDEDAASIKDAIECLRGVLKVVPHIADSDSYLVREQVKQELRERLWNALKDSNEKG